MSKTFVSPLSFWKLFGFLEKPSMLAASVFRSVRRTTRLNATFQLN